VIPAKGGAPVLVLTRRPGESVMIGDDVVITVLDVRGDVVRVGIKAPRSIQVHREEVYRELQKANRDAASPNETAVTALSKLLSGKPKS
jgi:carbon storage regulator